MGKKEKGKRDERNKIELKPMLLLDRPQPAQWQNMYAYFVCY